MANYRALGELFEDMRRLAQKYKMPIILTTPVKKPEFKLPLDEGMIVISKPRPTPERVVFTTMKSRQPRTSTFVVDFSRPFQF
jgi:hypothetical protein